MAAAEEDAKRLIRALAEGVADPGEPIATARVDAVAASAGLAPTAVDDALNFAGEKGWIEEGPHEGTICVTPAGWEYGKA